MKIREENYSLKIKTLKGMKLQPLIKANMNANDSIKLFGIFNDHL